MVMTDNALIQCRGIGNTEAMRAAVVCSKCRARDGIDTICHPMHGKISCRNVQ